MEKKRVNTTMDAEIFLAMRTEALKQGISFGELIERLWLERQAEEAGK